ncbi:hypothetical protein LTR66_007265 [Elasticomyces elasticus]|nr:hypothetical protein LTR28_005685 [Elasticomyces elasticus]KAK4988600.1 hypothetical protein LTR66_007265 [Elasticomyces elasticus]KAK4990688.1 hypothetical protein LTR50_002388 [Elasticomyces elasticus]
MTTYDGESSASEDGGGTETNVLLGYASKEPTDDTISQLGGYPSWLDSRTAPSAALAKCLVCNDMMSLLLQLNGDMPERFPSHERRLYLFTCRRRTCRRKEGSVRGVRATRASRIPETERQKERQAHMSKTPLSAPATPQTGLGESLFGVSLPTASVASGSPFSISATSTHANPFASPSASNTQNPFIAASALAAKPAQRTDIASLPETFASKARISSSPPSTNAPTTLQEPWPAKPAFPAAFPAYYLDADYESLESDVPTVPSNARVDMNMDIDDIASSSNSAKEDKEAFESTLDKTFQRFADRIGQNPEQVLRYEYGGIPLLYSRNDTVGKALAPYQPNSHANGGSKVKTAGARGKSGMSRCTRCGSERVFELQLTPHAITELEAEEIGLEGMEWGTVILGVCSADCVEIGKEGEVRYVQEWVAVQWEEQVSRK